MKNEEELQHEVADEVMKFANAIADAVAIQMIKSKFSAMMIPVLTMALSDNLARIIVTAETIIEGEEHEEKLKNLFQHSLTSFLASKRAMPTKNEPDENTKRTYN